MNWFLWIKETFSAFGLNNVNDKDLEEISEFISKPEILSVNFYLHHPDFMKFAFENDSNFKKIIKSFGGQKKITPQLFISHRIKKASNPVDYPLSFILEGSPLKNIFSSFFDKPNPEKEVGDKITELFNKIYEENKDIEIYINKLLDQLI